MSSVGEEQASATVATKETELGLQTEQEQVGEERGHNKTKENNGANPANNNHGRLMQGLGKMGKAVGQTTKSVAGHAGKAMSTAGKAVSQNTKKVVQKIKINKDGSGSNSTSNSEDEEKEPNLLDEPQEGAVVDGVGTVATAAEEQDESLATEKAVSIAAVETAAATAASKAASHKKKKKLVSPRAISEELNPENTHTVATANTRAMAEHGSEEYYYSEEHDNTHDVLSPPHLFGVVLIWMLSVAAMIISTSLYITLLQAQDGAGMLHRLFHTIVETTQDSCEAATDVDVDIDVERASACTDQEQEQFELPAFFMTLLMLSRYWCGLSWLWCAYNMGQVWGLEHIYQMALVIIWAVSTVVPVTMSEPPQESYSVAETLARARDLALLILTGQTRGTDMSLLLWEDELEDDPKRSARPGPSKNVAERHLHENATGKHKNKNRPDKKLFNWVKGRTDGVRRRVMKGKRGKQHNNKENHEEHHVAPAEINVQPQTRRRALQSSLKSYLNFHNVDPSLTESKKEKQAPWLHRLDPTRDSTNNDFMTKLLGSHPEYARARREEDLNTTATTSEDSGDSSMSPAKDSKFGQTAAPATTTDFQDVGDYVIQPLLQIRGMDIFVTDDPQSEIYNHPWFVEQGLREVPTFFMNGMTQWGNVLIYFKLPDWVKDFDESLAEKPEDPMDVRALKLFLKGDDDYRNERLKFVPAVVDGPMPVRVLAPPKKERTIHGTMIPITWTLYDKEVTASGKVLHPLVSCCMDGMSNSAVRNLAGLVKKYLAKLTADVALVIDEPRHDEKRSGEEPRACLGMFRFEHVDVDKCPDFPHHYSASEHDAQPSSDVVSMEESAESIAASEQARDLKKASQLVGMSTMELHDLTEELKVQ